MTGLRVNGVPHRPVPGGNIDADDLSVHLDNVLGTGSFSKEQYRQICDALTTKGAT